MPRHRVVNFIDMAPDKPGPVELQTLALTRQASARDIEVVSYFSRPIPASFRADIEAAGGRVGQIARPRWAAEVTAICRDERPRIAHFHFSPNSGLTEAAREGAVVIFTEHTPYDPQRLAAVRRLRRHWRARHVDQFVAVSDFLAGQVSREYLVPRSRVRVIRNGTDIDRFRPRPGERDRIRADVLGLAPDAFVITIAAHMRASKRQDLAIQAMPEVVAHAPAARLVLAGDGPERDRLHAMVDDHGLGEVVRFLHGSNDVAALYVASDVALLPSVSEGLPGGGIEALACGVPLVATPNGGTPEVYEDGVSGVSVTDQTSHGLAAVLLGLIADPDRRQRIGAAGRRRAEQLFTIERPAREMRELYEELLSARG